MSESPIDAMIRSAVSCTKCGSKGIGTCDCWEKCHCGWTKEKGGVCRNCQSDKKPRQLKVTHYGKGGLP